MFTYNVMNSLINAANITPGFKEFILFGDPY